MLLAPSPHSRYPNTGAVSMRSVAPKYASHAERSTQGSARRPIRRSGPTRKDSKAIRTPADAAAIRREEDEARSWDRRNCDDDLMHRVSFDDLYD